VSFHPLDVVVLNADLPAQGLKRGDLGAVVDISGPDAIDVEFVTASGRTKAVITLKPTDLRDVADDDLVGRSAHRRISQSPRCLNTHWSRRRAAQATPRLSC
jgi:hypothetical protein